MDAKIIMTVEQMADREKWLEARKQGIGGSEAAVILGVSKWASPYSLWAEKVGQKVLPEEQDEKTKERLHFGQVCEQVVADEFTLRTGKKVKRVGLMQSTKYPWMLASVDRMVVGENAGLECKTTEVWNADQWEGDNIPDSYFCQCLHYMAVTGADRWYIACLIGQGSYVWKPIERADVEEQINELIEAERDFWENKVLKRALPEVDSSQVCTDTLNARFEKLNEQTLIMTSEDDTLCEEIKELEAQQKAIKEQIDLGKNQLREKLEDHTIGDTFGFKLSYKFKNGAPKFLKDKFIEDHPEINLDDYYVKTQNRTLLITKKKDKDK